MTIGDITKQDIISLTEQTDRLPLWAIDWLIYWGNVPCDKLIAMLGYEGAWRFCIGELEADGIFLEKEDVLELKKRTDPK